MHGLKPMAHYYFREKIALAWFEEERFWPERYSRRSKINYKSDYQKRKVYVSATVLSA